MPLIFLWYINDIFWIVGHILLPLVQSNRLYKLLISLLIWFICFHVYQQNESKRNLGVNSCEKKLVLGTAYLIIQRYPETSLCLSNLIMAIYCFCFSKFSGQMDPCVLIYSSMNWTKTLFLESRYRNINISKVEMPYQSC